jgi:CDP-diacylglycerol--glycerol-3-phosphate 3-phosphatidyltransferase
MKLSWATRITLLRILLIIPFISCMLHIHDPDLSPTRQAWMRYLAIIIYLGMAISDGLDGYLARTRRQVTRLGTFLDPVADKLLITSACLLLASTQTEVSGFRIPVTVVVLIIAKDLLLILGFVIVYMTTSQVWIQPVFVGKAATALQLTMVAAVLIGPEMSQLIPGWIWFLRVLWWGAAASAVLATLVYIRNGSRYIEEYETAHIGSTS